MKKRFVVIGLLAASLAGHAQNKDSVYSKRKLSQSEVQVLFSYYTQDNNHSAVTGGLGTEDLQVYVTQLSYDVTKDSVDRYHLDAGVDVITSASTDNIDFVMSSASRTDARSHLRIGYDKIIPDKGLTIGGRTGFSIESDYLSVGNEVSVSHANASQSRVWSLVFQLYLDDLRWGRFENGHPQKLVYPAELRNKEWFDNYRRNSFNLSFDFYQVINHRMALGIYPSVTYQDGLLSTPFHRVYFTDDSERVENLPDHRWKFPIGIQLNSFVGSRVIVRTSYRFYGDDFGIVAHTFNVEAPIKLSPKFTITPVIRLYQQNGSHYFKPYGEHNSSKEYYTSDYDLSNFTSVKPGLGIRYTPFASNGRSTFNAVEIRYAYYKRSDGLEAHMITTYFDFGFERR